ncbi:MAG: sulfatase [Planctomycetes bacterium]|nr:sulfatase [Planctomycetota bacterium]
MKTSEGTDSAAGFGGTLRAALGAGLLVGLIFGLADGVVAGTNHVARPTTLVAWAGCLAASVFTYAVLWTALLGACGVLFHPWIKPRAVAERFRWLLATGLGGGLFLELYWWTRPIFFFGEHSLSPKRLAVAAVLLVVGLGLGVLCAMWLTKLSPALHARLRWLAILVCVGGFVFIQAEERKSAERGRITDSNRELPNVLLIVVDALRADMLGCYGNTQVKTPNIDELAARGVRFDSCYAQAPYTWTSFGSILTGKYPRRHGLVYQQAGRRMQQSNTTLPYHLKTAEVEGGGHLHDDDFSGGTFLTGALSHGTGLMRGFDVYTEMMMGHDLVQIGNAWSVFKSELLFSIIKNKLQQRVDSSLVVTMANDWMRDNRDKRWVAMVHLYSTHTPYDPPKEFLDLYADPDYDGPLRNFYSHHRIALEQGHEASEADLRQIAALYKGGVTQADHMIGELVDQLSELGILEDTLVIVTSDHGESLGEIHGEGEHSRALWEHNHMVETNLRIPLIMSNSYLLPHGVVVDGLAETVDLLPTICDLFGLKLPELEDRQYDLVDGRSLVPLIEGSAERLREYSFAENPQFLSIFDGRWRLVVERKALLLADQRAAVFADGAYTRLFDLRTDPGETKNRFREEPAEADRLLNALLSWNQGMPLAISVMEMDARSREQAEVLNKLGYTGGGITDEDAPDAGSPPE